jgi:hypothetical protein
MKDVQALKRELLELDAELKRFKHEILAVRVRQLRQTTHRPMSRPHPSQPAVPAHSC